jgi:DNA-binding beta-propeller fold protein YncE
MRPSFRLPGVFALLVGAAFAFTAAPAQASQNESAPTGNVMFVQTNDPSANAVAAFDRAGDGTLTYVASYSTGGAGGRESGSVSDPLASQGSLVRVPGSDLLLAVNAGSNTISVFGIDGDHLSLRQLLSSDGPFPVGFAVHGDLVYVLDAGGDGNVSGYRIAGGLLHPIARSSRTLGLGNSTLPFFLSSPAEVGFTPSGSQLIVTTKTNNTVDVFAVTPDGRLSAAPVKNTESPLPFSFVFDSAGRMVLNFAGSSSLQLFAVNANGTISPIGPQVGDGQAAACWQALSGINDFVANTGSNNVSQFQVSGGNVALVNGTAASDISGATDEATTGQNLYVLSSPSSTVRVFAIASDGALTPIQILTVPDGGSEEGIAIG